MPSITANCLTVVPLDADNIEGIAKSIEGMSHKMLMETLVRVCLSHERLRSELAGAEKVIDQMDRKQRHGCTDAFCQECDR